MRACCTLELGVLFQMKRTESGFSSISISIIILTRLPGFHSNLIYLISHHVYHPAYHFEYHHVYIMISSLSCISYICSYTDDNDGKGGKY